MQNGPSKTNLEMSLQNKITIYVWKRNEAFNSCGHVSMRTYVGGECGEGSYFSFWPKKINTFMAHLPEVISTSILAGHYLLNDEPNSVEGTFIKGKTIDGVYYPGYVIDTIAMSQTEPFVNEQGVQEQRIIQKREADWMFDFYCFPFMDKMFQRLFDYPPRWTLFAGSNFQQAEHSCASLIASMLEVCRGGNPGFSEVFSPERFEDKIRTTIKGYGKVITPNGVANLCEALLKVQSDQYNLIPVDGIPPQQPIVHAYQNAIQHREGMDEFEPREGMPAPLFGDGKLSKHTGVCRIS